MLCEVSVEGPVVRNSEGLLKLSITHGQNYILPVEEEAELHSFLMASILPCILADQYESTFIALKVHLLFALSPINTGFAGIFGEVIDALATAGVQLRDVPLVETVDGLSFILLERTRHIVNVFK